MSSKQKKVGMNLEVSIVVLELAANWPDDRSAELIFIMVAEILLRLLNRLLGVVELRTRGEMEFCVTRKQLRSCILFWKRWLLQL